MDENERSDYAFTLDGCEIKGIPAFETDGVAFEHDVRNKISDSIRYSLDSSGSATFTCTVKFDKWAWFKLTGLEYWVLRYCPNKRVVYLAKHAKKERTRHKNFKRAIRILGRYMQ